jgi:MFS family permease
MARGETVTRENKIQELETTAGSLVVVLLALFWGVTVLFYFHQYIFRVLPPVLHDQSHFSQVISTDTLNGLLLIFWLFYLMMQPVAGMLCSRYDLLKVFMGIVFFHAVGIALLFVSRHLFFLIISEAMMGFSSAFSLVICLYLTRRVVSSRWYTLVSGVVFSAGILGAIIGSFSMRVVFDYFNWQVVAAGLFALPCVLLFFSLLARPFIYRLVHNMQDRGGQTARVGFVSNLMLVIRNNRALYAYVFFLCAPLIPFVVTWLVPFVTLDLHRHDMYTEASTGVVFLGMFFGSLGLGLLAGFFRAHRTRILFLLSLSGFMLTLVLVWVAVPLPWMIFILFCLGVVLSGHVVAGGLVAERSSACDVAYATSIYTLAINLGGTVLLFLFACAFKMLGLVSATPSLHVFRIVLTTVPASFLLAMIFAWCIHCKS